MRYQKKYDELIGHYFMPWEAIEFKELPKRTPALKMMIAEREYRRKVFEGIFRHHVNRATVGWMDTRASHAIHWYKNVLRLYALKGALVQKGRRQRQPSPWALYREANKRATGDERTPATPGYKSGEGKRKVGGVQLFDKAQVAERRASTAPVSQTQLRVWINDVDRAMRRTRNKDRKAGLARQKANLEKMLR